VSRGGSARRGCRRRPRQFPTSSPATPPKEAGSPVPWPLRYRLGRTCARRASPSSGGCVSTVSSSGSTPPTPAPTTGPTCSRCCTGHCHCCGTCSTALRGRPVVPTGGSQQAMSGWGAISSASARVSVKLRQAHINRHGRQQPGRAPWRPRFRHAGAAIPAGTTAGHLAGFAVYSGTGLSVRWGAVQPNLREEWACRWRYRSIAARDRALPGWIHRY
jgi:hypothetical protein